MTGTLALDTSALVSLASREPDAEWFAHQLVNAESRLVSAGSIQEFLIVLATHHARTGVPLQHTRAYALQLLAGLNVIVEPVTAALALIGSAGVLKYRGSPARLNFGDGFSYALAKSRAIPLLCKGDDFPHTDIEVLQPRS